MSSARRSRPSRLVTNELDRQIDKNSPYRRGHRPFLRSQAQRLPRDPAETRPVSHRTRDPLHASLSVTEMLHEAAAALPPAGARRIVVKAAAHGRCGRSPGPRLPEGVRRPGVIYGLENIIENAADFCKTRVEVSAEWDGQTGHRDRRGRRPGAPSPRSSTTSASPTSRRAAEAAEPAGQQESREWASGSSSPRRCSERSGSRLPLKTEAEPEQGAIVPITWPRQLSKQPWNCASMPAPRRHGAA